MEEDNAVIYASHWKDQGLKSLVCYNMYVCVRWRPKILCLPSRHRDCLHIYVLEILLLTYLLTYLPMVLVLLAVGVFVINSTYSAPRQDHGLRSREACQWRRVVSVRELQSKTVVAVFILFFFLSNKNKAHQV